MDIGCNIKRLRQTAALTQEELAERIGVTPQAVSKWENGVGLPDISQVVPLARVFGVSTDELFGVVNAESEEEISIIEEEIYRKAHIKHNVINTEVLFDGYREALKRFPDNKHLIEQLLFFGANVVNIKITRGDNDAKEVFNECERLALRLLHNDTDVSRRMRAHSSLVRLYSTFGLYDKAVRHAEEFPDARDNRGWLLAGIKREMGDNDGEIAQRCKNITEIMTSFIHECMMLGTAYKQVDDALKVLIAMFSVIETVYQDTPPLLAPQLHAKVAKCYMHSGDIETALDWLDRFYDYHIARIMAQTDDKPPATPFLVEYIWKGTLSRDEVTAAAREEMKNELSYLEKSEIARHPRYIALRKRVDALI